MLLLIIADNSVYMALASILSVFDISPSKDSAGKAIHLEASSESEFLSWVLHYLGMRQLDGLLTVVQPSSVICARSPHAWKSPNDLFLRKVSKSDGQPEHENIPSLIILTFVSWKLTTCHADGCWRLDIITIWAGFQICPNGYSIAYTHEWPCMHNTLYN